jgi:hypothetical protein
MSDDTKDTNDKAAPGKSAKKAFSGGKKRDDSVLFAEDEMDVYCNKMTKEAFIFHAVEIDYSALERMEYNHDTFRAKVFMKDGRELDLGVKIQWLIRPYFSKAQEVQVIRTVDGEPVDGTFIPLSHRRTT